MELNTASEVISFSKKLEEDSAKFYEDLSRRYDKDRDILLSFARENRKNTVQVERAYYGVISDAIEGCFAFNIDPDAYALETGLAEGMTYSGAVEKAVEIERKMMEFYSAAAKQSESYMADVPRAFTMVVKKRNKRGTMLQSLLGKKA